MTFDQSACRLTPCRNGPTLTPPIGDGRRDRFLHRLVDVMKLKILVHQAEEGGYWAEVPALPGCVTEGDTLEETLANVREAAEGWLEVSATRTPPDPEAQLVEIEL